MRSVLMRSVMQGTLRGSVSRLARAHKAGAGAAAVALALAVVPAGAGVAAASSGQAARAARPVASGHTPLDDPTASQDNLRTGWDPSEPGLSPSVVHGSTFGQVFKTSVNGQVYAQPLVVGSTVIVATENNWVYGLNASTGAVKWSTSLGKPYAIKTCGNIVPNVGVTSTPVYDPSSGNVYVMANINTGKSIAWRLFGVNATTGAINFTKGVSGSPSNDSHITFNGTQQLQRPGLLLLNGWVYAAFSSHCDHQPYAGYVSAIDPANGNATLWTDESGATNNQAGIWQSGGGLISDGPNRIILTSGNGVSPAKGPGSSPPGQLAESVVRLQQNSNNTLSAQDFFSPADAPTLDQNDLDYGASGPAELPVGTTAYPHVIVQDGKVGHIFLLNANNLGGREQGSGSSDNDLYQSNAYGGLWGHPAIFEQSTSAIPASSSGNGDYVFIAGKNDPVREFEVDTNSSGVPRLNDVANSTFQFPYGSGSPVVTSNGTDPNSAVVWVTQNNGGSSSTLVAFPVVPVPAKGGGVKLTEINGLPIGTAANYTIPATGNGMVYVAPATATSTASGSPRGPRCTAARSRRSAPPRWARPAPRRSPRRRRGPSP